MPDFELFSCHVANSLSISLCPSRFVYTVKAGVVESF